MEERQANPFHHHREEKPLYVVALPEGPVVKHALNWQRNLIERFPVYNREPFPPLHVTLASLKPPGAMLPEVVRRLDDLCRRLAPVFFRATGFGCFGPPALAVTVYIERSKALTALARAIQDELAPTDLLLPLAVEGWAFHMTLSSATTADEPWDELTYARACYQEAARSIPLEGTLTSIALWLPEFRPLAEVKRFPLY